MYHEQQLTTSPIKGSGLFICVPPLSSRAFFFVSLRHEVVPYRFLPLC